MKIGVNSRIFQNKNSGIPYYVYLLYSKIIQIDKKNEYVFFQTDDAKKIGNTAMMRRGNGLFSAVIFDYFLVNKLIKKEGVAVFHGASSILPFWKKKNIEYVTTVYDLAFLVFPDFYSWIYRAYHRYSIGRSLAMADRVVCISQNTQNDVIRFFGTDRKKIQVIYPGVNEYFFAKEDLQRPISEKYFFSVTTHPSRKNIFNALVAMSRSDVMRQYKYVIAGLMNADHVDGLKKISKQLGIERNIILPGYVSEDKLKAYYAHADFSIYPSFYEGFGFPVVESMILRCPVLSSNASSLAELSTADEWTFNPNDIDGMRGAMERMVSLDSEKRKVLIEKNYEFAKNFTWDRAAKQMINVLEE